MGEAAAFLVARLAVDLAVFFGGAWATGVFAAFLAVRARVLSFGASCGVLGLFPPLDLAGDFFSSSATFLGRPRRLGELEGFLVTSSVAGRVFGMGLLGVRGFFFSVRARRVRRATGVEVEEEVSAAFASRLDRFGGDGFSASSSSSSSASLAAFLGRPRRFGSVATFSSRVDRTRSGEVIMERWKGLLFL